MMLEGILPVLKPAGMTSHDVVARVRRMTKERRIGHTGTLDPEVTGVLPLCIGRATRLVEYIQELPKQYEAELTVGFATDTEDRSGTVIESADCITLAEDEVMKALRSFVGLIEQIPPMYSAVRVDGKRLYELAREGKEVERKPRTVRIERIEVLDMKLKLANPTIRFRVTCSKGTYIRTLCVDIGRVLGYPAHMSALVRTATGGITLDTCLTLEDIGEYAVDGRLQRSLIRADEAIAYMPAFELDEAEAAKALQGRSFPLANGNPATLYRGYGPENRFLGVFRYVESSGLLKPEKIFN